MRWGTPTDIWSLGTMVSVQLRLRFPVYLHILALIITSLHADYIADMGP